MPEPIPTIPNRPVVNPHDAGELPDGVRSLGQCLIEWQRRREVERAQAAASAASESGTSDLSRGGQGGTTAASD